MHVAPVPECDPDGDLIEAYWEVQPT